MAAWGGGRSMGLRSLLTRVGSVEEARLLIAKEVAKLEKEERARKRTLAGELAKPDHPLYDLMEREAAWAVELDGGGAHYVRFPSATTQVGVAWYREEGRIRLLLKMRRLWTGTDSPSNLLFPGFHEDYPRRLMALELLAPEEVPKELEAQVEEVGQQVDFPRELIRGGYPVLRRKGHVGAVVDIKRQLAWIVVEGLGYAPISRPDSALERLEEPSRSLGLPEGYLAALRDGLIPPPAVEPPEALIPRLKREAKRALKEVGLRLPRKVELPRALPLGPKTAVVWDLGRDWVYLQSPFGAVRRYGIPEPGASKEASEVELAHVFRSAFGLSAEMWLRYFRGEVSLEELERYWTQKNLLEL